MSSYPTPGSSSSFTASPGTVIEEEQKYAVARIGNAQERRREQNRKSQQTYRAKHKKGAEKIEFLIREDKEAEERILLHPKFPLCPEYERHLAQGFVFDEETYGNVDWSVGPSFPIASIIGRQFMPSIPPELVIPAESWLEATGPLQNGYEFFKRHVLIIMNAIDIHLPQLGITTEMLIDRFLISPYVMPENTYNEELEARINGLKEYIPHLAPVDLQRSIPHHPYIDLIPFPAFRTTILEILRDTPNTINQVDFCQDIELGGLRLWGTHSYEPMSYELTEAFAAKWGYLFCRDAVALNATNYWRNARGEHSLGPLDFGGSPGAGSSQNSFYDLYLVQMMRESLGL
ncbi:uncharacterized protein H6S33_008591 [Morchella sextelata]|uniref:uncharacterized protein n=1 Tax=Morchella sextelata TaxID=1174677 RepID=UPI001D04FD6C|nr:uncharacterized protein H6S33_008591 [Morchella sextelata]KAH0602510.1 hypothetical protein H6S33_008591 [Morchella sextelata]